MSYHNVTAIVVNWRLKTSTVSSLRSLQAMDPDIDLLVVDNGSQDGSVAYISDQVPEADLIRLPSNVGFGAACNRAVRQALRDPDCEFVFLLNNDAVVARDALSALMSAAAEDPEAGIFGPKVLYADDRRRLWYAGARSRRWVLAAKDTGRGKIDCGQYDHVCHVDYVFGAAMLIRREVIEQIGLFDEKFFLYLEDMDFCRRARAAGFALRFVPSARVWHCGSASTADHRELRDYHFVRSTLYFLRKHTSVTNLPAVAVFWFLVCLRTVLVDILSGRWSSLRSYRRGLQAGLRRPKLLEGGAAGIGEPLRKGS